MSERSLDQYRRLDAAVRAATRGDSRSLEPHPSPRELADYSLGVHGAEREHGLQEHLSACSECANLVLGLMHTPDVEVEDVPRGDGEDAWQRLQERLRPAAPVAPPARMSTVTLRWALAASFAVSLGLAGWTAHLRARLEQERDPSAAVTVLDLEPTGMAADRGPAERSNVRRISRGRVVLLLNLGDLRDFASYRVELVGGRGETLWATETVRRGDEGSFALDLPADRLQAGTYEVRVYGVGAGAVTRLAGYRFALVE